MLRTAVLVVALLGFAAVICFDRGAAARAAAERDLLRRKIGLLTQENERLRGLVAAGQKERSQARTREQRAEIERQVESIRGLKFKQPVVYAEVSRAQIKAVVAQKLADAYSEQEFAQMAAAFAQLGVLPPAYPLRQRYIDLLGEQIAAFYDQHEHKLFMFEDASLENRQTASSSRMSSPMPCKISASAFCACRWRSGTMTIGPWLPAPWSRARPRSS